MFFEGFEFPNPEDEKHPNFLIYVQEGSITLFYGEDARLRYSHGVYREPSPDVPKRLPVKLPAGALNWCVVNL